MFAQYRKLARFLVLGRAVAEAAQAALFENHGEGAGLPRYVARLELRKHAVARAPYMRPPERAFDFHKALCELEELREVNRQGEVRQFPVAPVNLGPVPQNRFHVLCLPKVCLRSALYTLITQKAENSKSILRFF